MPKQSKPAHGANRCAYTPPVHCVQPQRDAAPYDIAQYVFGGDHTQPLLQAPLWSFLLTRFFLHHDCDSCGESSVAVATSRFIVVQDMLTPASVRHIPAGMATVTCLDASQSGHHLVAGTNTSDLLLWWVHHYLLLHACCHPPLHVCVSPPRSLSLSQ